MIKISNERELLPIIRNPLADWEKTEKLLLPLFWSFVESDSNIDKYEGWAFSIKFIKNSNIEYQFVVDSIDGKKQIEKYDWKFAPSVTNRNESIWIHDHIAIVTHQESWLWFG